MTDQQQQTDQHRHVRDDQHGTTTGYRLGCRCRRCRQVHAADARARRHAQLYGPGGPLGPAVQRAILRDVRRGMSVAAAAERHGLTYQAVYAACRALSGFGTALAAAEEAEEARHTKPRAARRGVRVLPPPGQT